MQDLRISLVQSDVHWHEIGANLATYEEKIWSLKGKTDLVLLPEMFQTGFSMQNTELAEPMNFTTFKWMKQMALQIDAVIAGSFMVKEEGEVFNRLIWMQPNGEWQKYDKRHLFRMADEHDHFDFGTERLIVEWRGWKICPMVCYDLRFPVWSRNRNLEYDLLLYVANWPAVRVNAWDALLKARAIENVSYTAGLNRVGTDGNGIEYNGHSGVYSPKGETLAFSDPEVSGEEIITLTLSREDLDHFRAKFPAHLDADDFEIKKTGF
ncbi:amidohydrolase [Roseivirga sp.]|uniref:amidohydrolase n=1 Tax=Roseivirga sp. TaxID=1964215 RepID=UPI002B276D02|nr:amidohydrolase [Roseivirga sp.]